MRDKMTHLSQHLFSQIERLSEENITPEKLELEIKKAVAITKTSREIIDVGKLVLEAHKAMDNLEINTLPAMLTDHQKVLPVK